MEYFDTHAHLNFPDYNKDREEVIKRCLAEEISVINVGTEMEESKKVIMIAEENRKNYAAIGLHPLYVEKEDFDIEEYKGLLNKKVVAIGETGLDYKYTKDEKVKEKQKAVFKKHLHLADISNLPVILHCRMAHEDLLDILKGSLKGGGVIHCFSGGSKEVKEYLDLGLYFGINGIVFKMNLEKAIKEIPLDKIVLETDCPFLSPLPSTKRSEPLFLKHIAKEVARIKNISPEKVAQKTTENAKKLFQV